MSQGLPVVIFALFCISYDCCEHCVALDMVLYIVIAMVVVVFVVYFLLLFMSVYLISCYFSIRKHVT